MKLDVYKNLTKSPVHYLSENISKLVFDNGYVSVEDDTNFKDIELTESVKESICRMVGISPSLSKSLYSIDKQLWDTVLTRLYTYHNKDTIILLLTEREDGTYSTKGLCNASRETVPSKRFVDKTVSYFEDHKDCEIEDVNYSNETLQSTVIISTPEYYKTYSGVSYRLGYVLYNDELYNSYCRSVVILNKSYYYLPSKYYNLSTSRYDRSTGSSEESLDVMLLRISDDIESNTLNNVKDSIGFYIDTLSKVRYSYQEFSEFYNTILNACVRSCLPNIEDVISLMNDVNDIEEIYGEIQNEYVWRCTAFSKHTFSKLYNIVDQVEASSSLFPEDAVSVRELTGRFLVSKKMNEVVAIDRGIHKIS